MPSHTTVPGQPKSHYDLIVINSGQGGGPLTGAFAKAGKRVALVERAHVGRSCVNERAARAAGRRVRIAKMPMSSVARALEVDETRGFMKAVVDADTGRILGARVLGIEGGEVATLFQVAMMGDLPYTAMRDAVFSHPTLAEALNNLFTAMDRAG